MMTMTTGAPDRGGPKKKHGKNEGGKNEGGKREHRLPRYLPVWLFSLVRWPSPETTEAFCLRAALWWVLLLLPGLHLFAANPAFADLRRFGAEGTWQKVMGAALTVQVVAVCLGNVWGRVVALFAFGTIWAFIAGLFWAGSPHLLGIPRNTGVGLYSALATDCFVVAIHLVRLWYIDHLTRQPPCPAAQAVPPAARS